MGLYGLSTIVEEHCTFDTGPALQCEGNAACAADRDQQTWILAVVQRAEPDSWRDRIEDGQS